MEAHRTLLVRLPKDKCDVDYIKRLMALTNLAYRGFEVWVPDIPKTVQHQLYGFKNYMRSLVLGTVPKRWFVRAWIPSKILRVYQDGSRKGDKSAPVVLDLKNNVIKIRWVCKNEISIPMPDWVVNWIDERVREGGDVRFAMIGLKDNEPYLALTAEREVKPHVPSDYILVVDVNSWRYGISWGLIRNSEIVSHKQEGINLGKYYRLYDEVVRLEKKYGALKRLGLHKTVEGSRLWSEIKILRMRLYAITRDRAYFLASKLARKALRYRALLVIDDMIEESRRELLEEKLPPDVIKLLMSNLKRFVHQLETLAQWYGVPYKFKRLPSTVCPICGSELTQLPGRIMVCENCGFKAPRDKVPMYWAIKLTHFNIVNN